MKRVLIASLGAAGLVALLSCATIHQDSAQSALAQGRLDDAAVQIQTALASDPDNLELKHLAARIFTQRGVKYYQNGEMIAAGADFHRAADYDPFYGEGWDYLGLIAFSQHDWQNAIDHGKKAAALSGQAEPGYVTQAEQELHKVLTGGLGSRHHAPKQSSTARP